VLWFFFFSRVDLLIFVYGGRLDLLNTQPVDYPSFKLVLVGDGGTGKALDLVVSSLSVALECCRTFDKLRLLFMPSCREDDVREEAHH